MRLSYSNVKGQITVSKKRLKDFYIDDNKNLVDKYLDRDFFWNDYFKQCFIDDFKDGTMTKMFEKLIDTGKISEDDNICSRYGNAVCDLKYENNTLTFSVGDFDDNAIGLIFLYPLVCIKDLPDLDIIYSNRSDYETIIVIENFEVKKYDLVDYLLLTNDIFKIDPSKLKNLNIVDNPVF